MANKKAKYEKNEFPGNVLIVHFEAGERKGTMSWDLPPETPALYGEEVRELFRERCRNSGIRNAKIIEICRGDVVRGLKGNPKLFGGRKKYFITPDVPRKKFGLKSKKPKPKPKIRRK
ncbi:MAG: hypothetical protein V1672_04015 [Candidatus Diapherotrites archaeon]